MSKKIYSYRTNKLYESENDSFSGPFYIKVDFDCNGKSGCCYIEDETDNPAEFDSYIDAYDNAATLADEKAEEVGGIVEESKDVIEILSTKSGDCVYRYTIVDNTDECGSCNTLDGDDEVEYEVEYDDDTVEESVASRFGKYRKLYEGDEDDKDGKDDENGDEESKDEDSKKDDDEGDEDKEEGGDDDELKAIKLTVAKDDADKCKEELVDAGIEEGDIEILDGDDDNSIIRVDVNSVMPLKDYLDGKGINLEDEIGAEIISDDEGDEGEGDEKKGDEGEGDEKKKGDEGDDDFNFDTMDFFGDDGESK